MPKRKSQTDTGKPESGEEEPKKPARGYNPDDKTRKRLHAVGKRIEAMRTKKEQLGINRKIERMDRLYTPHFISPNELDQSLYYDENASFDRSLLEESIDERKRSRPLAFQKITTAQARLISENIKVRAKPNGEQYKNTSLIAVKTHEENWSANKSYRQLRLSVRDAAKYGFGYARRFYEQIWRWLHDDEGNLYRDYLKNDVVFKYIHPSSVLLDDCCTGPENARDCAIEEYYDEEEFKSRFPTEEYPDARYVLKGTERTFSIVGDSYTQNKQKLSGEGVRQYHQITYERLLHDTREIIVNGVMVSSEELPGHELSILGMKWHEDKEDYDAIGIGQVLELYQPLVDDILNADDEWVRQMVRPVKYMGNDVTISDDSDREHKAGAEVRVTGDLNQVKWDRPPDRTAGQQQWKKDLEEEIDTAIGIPKAFEGLDKSDTAYQAAQNREEAIQRLRVPLDEIKGLLDADANKAFRLYREVYSIPQRVDVLDPQSPEYADGMKVLQQNPNDPRFVMFGDDEQDESLRGKMARRRFKSFETNLAKKMEKRGNKLVDTGVVVESEEREFWEMIPEHFNWEGVMEILPMSFMPASEAIQQQREKEDAEFLLSIPALDKSGQPLLMDALGQVYRIDKVRVVKEWVESRHKDPDKYVIVVPKVPIPGEGEGEPASGIDAGTAVSDRELSGIDHPEERVMDRIQKQVTETPAV